MKAVEWVENFRSSTLDPYLSLGGSVFRVVVRSHEMSEILLSRVENLTEKETFTRVVIIQPDTQVPGEKPVTKLEGLYAQVAKDYDFKALIAQCIVRHLAHHFPNVSLGSDLSVSFLSDICQSQERDVKELLRELKTQIRNNGGFSRSFASAVTVMIDLLTAGPENVHHRIPNSSLHEVLQRWFNSSRAQPGDKVILRELHVYSWIDRTNVMFALTSLLRFRLLAGMGPTVLVFDSWDSEVKGATKSQWANLLHMFREIIDHLEILEGFAVIFCVGSDVIISDYSKRGFSNYPAFHMRVCNDIKSDHANPDSMLVEIKD